MVKVSHALNHSATVVCRCSQAFNCAISSHTSRFLDHCPPMSLHDDTFPRCGDDHCRTSDSVFSPRTSPDRHLSIIQTLRLKGSSSGVHRPDYQRGMCQRQEQTETIGNVHSYVNIVVLYTIVCSSGNNTTSFHSCGYPFGFFENTLLYLFHQLLTVSYTPTELDAAIIWQRQRILDVC